MQQQILVIDDDGDACSMLELILTGHGFRVLTAAEAVTGLRATYQHRPDAIILDIQLPGMDGFEACRRIREMTNAPILILTAQRTTTEDVVRGFEMGADDYITRPFEIPELISRLRACLRRASSPTEEECPYLFPTLSIMLDCERHELMINEQTIYLSPSEFEVLHLLVRHAGRTLSPEAILTQVWGPQHIGDGHLIKQYIYQLRQKIELNPAEPKYIQTIRGEGYYFATERN